MSFRRAVASNVAVQAIGPASAFLTVVIVARLGGPSDQGQFAQYKAWVDLMVVLGLFGFPQSFIYVINRLGGSAGTLARWSRLYSLAFVPIALAASALAVHAGLAGAAAGAGSVVVLTLAAAALVLHGLWRGIYLTRNADVGFALFTILPAVSLLASLTVAMLVGWRQYDRIILASTIPAAAVAALMMAPVLRDRGTGYRQQPWGALLSNGLHAFLQAMLLTAQPLVAYALVRHAGGANREIGFLNAGLFLVQGLAVPITMVAPLLFARWTSVADDTLMSRLHALTWRALGIGALAGIGLALAAALAVPLVFGAEYRAAVLAVQAMLLTLPLVCHVRVIAPALHSRGRPGVNTAAGAIRLATFAVAGLLLARASAQPIVAIAAAWSVAELGSAAWILIGLRYAAVDATGRAVPEPP